MLVLEPPSDIKEIFKNYAQGGGAYMTQAQLSRFLVEVQGIHPENAATEVRKIVEGMLKRRPHIAKNTSDSLSLDDFFYYLFSVDLNPAFESHIHQDMKGPLSHYFIYTSHNSYLTGNQLTGDCSDRLIIKVLQRGVRVIELDLWPTSSKDDIQVFHGRTLTTPVDLLTCLRAIRDYAFEKSEYPVIITLEDHLKPKLQAKAAEVVSPFPPSDKIGINSVQREAEEIVPMKRMKMDWIPYIPFENRDRMVERLKSDIFILGCTQRRLTEALSILIP